MSLQPNIIERRLISSGKLPWLMPDVMLAMIVILRMSATPLKRRALSARR